MNSSIYNYFRKEEIDLLDDFRRRKKALLDKSTVEVLSLTKVDETNKQKKKMSNQDWKNEQLFGGIAPSDIKKIQKQNFQNLYDTPKVFTNDEIIMKENYFSYFMLDNGVTTCITTLNRVNTYYYMLSCGNFDGVISW